MNKGHRLSVQGLLVMPVAHPPVATPTARRTAPSHPAAACSPRAQRPSRRHASHTGRAAADAGSHGITDRDGREWTPRAGAGRKARAHTQNAATTTVATAAAAATGGSRGENSDTERRAPTVASEKSAHPPRACGTGQPQRAARAPAAAPTR
eukprot:TRINITY_DN1455_c0_g1_i8.p3 TRINITY_DN1455_c0_g1~~TRINITY_DN1455_c0_g1_i8.p3  ORF type:complete len:152 (-),score=1.90 TRINITY_DN1455_c0_g1_i8:66-521(-)